MRQSLENSRCKSAAGLDNLEWLSLFNLEINMVSLLAFIIIVIIILAVFEEFYQIRQRQLRIKRASEAKSKLANGPKLTPQQQREQQKKAEYYNNLYGD
jgi:hypothetical protein